MGRREAAHDLGRHGLDFAEAEEMFSGPMLVALDMRHDYPEDRWIGLGMSQGRVLVVAFAERNDGHTIRIISLRKALKHEQKAYEEIIRN